MAIRSMAVCLLAVALAAPASAAKWASGCPKVRQKFTKVGTGVTPSLNPYAISRFFEHVGHEMTFYLLKANPGEGFSTDPDDNTVEVTFKPLGGAPIPLPPFTVTATSPTTLTFVVPDSRPALGRLVVGPAEFVVKRGTTTLFMANKQLILPPMNDVRVLVNAGYDVDVLAAMGPNGGIWIPLGFKDFGQTGSPLPECPTVLTPVTAFALDASLKKGDDQALPYVHMGQLRKNKLFLGDYVTFDFRANMDVDMYGNKLVPAHLSIAPAKGHGVVLCGLNDALELVVLIKATNPALQDKSELLALVQDGSPVVLKIENISLDPDVAPLLERATYDSLKQTCYPAE
jgi:hypothetical protein